MAVNPTSVLADARALAQLAMTQTATIARTGAVVPCRIDLDTGSLNYTAVPSLPRFIRLQQWIIYMPYGTDLNLSDTFTSNGSTYVVLNIDNPRTYATKVTAHGAITYSSETGWPVVFNQTVSFRDPTTRQTLANVPVVIERINWHDQADPYTLNMDYYVAWQSTLTYPDGTTHIDAGDEIHWAPLQGGKSTIAKPITTYGSVPIAYSVFKEMA